MEQANHTAHYDAYLLRIWSGEKVNACRWMLQNIRTGEQKGFRDLDALVRFLTSMYGETEAAALNSRFQK